MQKCIWTCVLHIQMALRTTQNRPKSADFRTFSQLFAIKKRIGKSDEKNGFLSIFGPFRGPKMTPKTIKMGEGDWVFVKKSMIVIDFLIFWCFGWFFHRFWDFFNGCHTVSQWLLYCFGAKNDRISPVFTWKIIDFRCFAFLSVSEKFFFFFFFFFFNASTKRRSDASTMRRIDESTNRPIDESTNHRLVPSSARRNARSG